MSSTRLPQLTDPTTLVVTFNQLTRAITSKFNELDNNFRSIQLRKSNKVPANSADTSGDAIGDFNYDASYLYILVDNAGTLEWRRATLSSF